MPRITLGFSPSPRRCFEQSLEVADGATAHEAVRASLVPLEYPQLDWQALTPGMRGKAIDWQHRLKDGDRLELCRPLKVDPKVARRERFRQQGARGTGLFARRREGGKAGY